MCRKGKSSSCSCAEYFWLPTDTDWGRSTKYRSTNTSTQIQAHKYRNRQIHKYRIHKYHVRKGEKQFLPLCRLLSALHWLGDAARGETAHLGRSWKMFKRRGDFRRIDFWQMPDWFEIDFSRDLDQKRTLLMRFKMYSLQCNTNSTLIIIISRHFSSAAVDCCSPQERGSSWKTLAMLEPEHKTLPPFFFSM